MLFVMIFSLVFVAFIAIFFIKNVNVCKIFHSCNRIWHIWLYHCTAVQRECWYNMGDSQDDSEGKTSCRQQRYASWPLTGQKRDFHQLFLVKHIWWWVFCKHVIAVICFLLLNSSVVFLCSCFFFLSLITLFLFENVSNYSLEAHSIHMLIHQMSL